MSHLIALVFNDPFAGEEARAALQRMAGEGLLEIDDTVLIRHALDGKMSVTQEDKLINEGQKTGHVLGLVAAAITGTMPLILAGTLAGRLISRLMDHGITRSFVNSVKKEVSPGKSVLVVLGEADPERRQFVADHLQGFGLKVLHAEVPATLLQRIDGEIEKDRAA
jgi:uncharacterized membrane protein